MVYSQTSKCDSLKTVYESKLFDWYKVDVKLKTHDYTNKNEYDFLLALYHSSWKKYIENKREYLDFVKDSTLVVKREYPYRWERMKPIPKFSINEYCCKDSLQLESLPRLNKNLQTRMVDYIMNNYPADFKKRGVSSKALLEFVCDKNGMIKNIQYLFIKPKDSRCNDLFIDTLKLLQFIPSRNKHGFKDIKMSVYILYNNRGEFVSNMDNKKDKLILEFIPIY